MNLAVLYYEDYVVGTVHETLGRTITETDVVIHAGQTGDFYPHHMDAEFMRTHPFGQRVAHGTLVLSIAIGLTSGDVNPAAFSYGYDRVRFIKPVPIGDTLRVRAAIHDKELDLKRPGFGRVTESVEVFNQHNEIVLACQHLYLVECRDAAR
ncbi:MAG: MaoC/PaaZ C-terminal domain-containing protein [Anaerolineae bacterium]